MCIYKGLGKSNPIFCEYSVLSYLPAQVFQKGGGWLMAEAKSWLLSISLVCCWVNLIRTP